MNIEFSRWILKPLFAVLAFAIVSAMAAPVGACQIPVFRYALERWEPDPYELLIVHRGPLSAEHEQQVQDLRTAVDAKESFTNVLLSVVDLDVPSEDPFLKSVAEQHPQLAEPKALLYFPRYRSASPLAWSGDLSETTLELIADSPLRKTISQRLIDGQTAVWVLIESGDQAKDDEAFATLEKEIAQVTEKLALPSKDVIEADEKFKSDTKVDLRIEFSILKVSRDDAAEAVFLSMLLASETDLHEYNEPIAVPIFGRGRTYFALVGKGINAEMVEENCEFLTGACSCEVKRQNPGVDLVFNVDWESQITSSEPEQALPEITGIGDLVLIEETDLDDELDEPSPANSDVAEAPAYLTGPATVVGEQVALATPASPATTEPDQIVGDVGHDVAAETTLIDVAELPSANTLEENSVTRTLMMWVVGFVLLGIAVTLVGRTLRRPQES